MTEIEIKFENGFLVKEMLALREHDHIDKLTIHSEKIIATEVTRLLLRSVKSISVLSIRQTMTRTALRDCFALPNLHTLELLELTTPGKVIDVSQATNLQVLRSDFSTKTDLSIFSRLPNLVEIRSHNSDWTVELAERFTQKISLKVFDIEASRITDEMVHAIAQSKTITELDVGASRVTGKGLESIANMQQLEELDIWETEITEVDLAVLKQLDNLEYLAIGGGAFHFKAETLVPFLLSMPNLKRIWLDNIEIDDEHLKMLEGHFESVRHDYYPFEEEE